MYNNNNNSMGIFLSLSFFLCVCQLVVHFFVQILLSCHVKILWHEITNIDFWRRWVVGMGGVANFGVGGGCLHPNYGGTPLDGEENNNIRKKNKAK